MKKLIVLLMCVQLTFTAFAAAWTGLIATSYDGGVGTKENPFQIATPDQLALLGDSINTKGKTYFGKYFVLTADLDLSNLPWSPIGGVSATTTSPTVMFKGSFDGQNHSISNLSCTSTSGFIGLFGYAKRATIKNLNIASGAVQGGFNVGALVGRADSTFLYNCKNAATVKGTVPQSSSTWVGGIVGTIGGVGMIVEYCSNSGAITGNGEHAGGVVGNVGVTNLSTNNCHIAYCSNSGAVTSYTQKAGGIVGTDGGVYCPIDQCFNTGKISVVQNAAGGIVGYGYGDYPISNCYNTGEVAYSGAANPAVFTGGILGITGTSTPTQRYFKSITNCYSNGVIVGGCREVIAAQLNTGAPTGYGLVTNCYGLNRQLLPENAVNGGFLQFSGGFKTTAFITSLNTGAISPIWTIDANLNGGFPILVWQTVAVPGTTALNSVEIAKFANVYASNKAINVDVKENVAVSITVYNVTGALIAQQKSAQSLTTVAVPQGGLYIVKVSDGNRSFSSKVVVR